MKICGIICELNPAHNGHKFLIEEVKRKTNCDLVIAIMSGNFVQRGEPAIFDYQTRAQMAINVGFDAVIYLPTVYTLNSAENFARQTLFVASQFNLDYLAFGANSNEEILYKINDLKQNVDFNNLIKNNLSKGFSFSNSFSKAVYENLHTNITANDILALEYLSVIKDKKYSFTPIIINRNNEISATKIRKLILTKQFDKLSNMIDENNLNLIKKSKVNNYNKFNMVIYSNIISSTKETLVNIKDMREGIENKIYNANSNTLYGLNKQVKSKRYNQKYLNRLYLNILFGITKDSNVMLPYLKIVAVKNKTVLNNLKCKLPLITTLKNKNILNENSIYDYDILSSKIYNSVNKINSNTFPYQKIIIHN